MHARSVDLHLVQTVPIHVINAAELKAVIDLCELNSAEVLRHVVERHPEQAIILVSETELLSKLFCPQV